MSRVGILFSGRGSNMGALLAAAAAPDFPGRIVLAIGNRPGAGGFDLAAAHGIATRCIDHLPFAGDREAHERSIDAALREAGVTLVCLAGYMRRLTPYLVAQWAGRMLNVHPSLLPAFPGLHTHRRALATGVKLHGCTVHIVTDTVDDGPILAQAASARTAQRRRGQLGRPRARPGTRALSSDAPARPGRVPRPLRPGRRVAQPLARHAGRAVKAPIDRGETMAQVQQETRDADPITQSFFLDRQAFWNRFTSFATYVAGAIVVLLILMWFFLV